MRSIGLWNIYIGFCLTVMLGGCSVAEGPERLEPVVRMLEAEEIGRDCALLRAEVERRGAEGVGEIRFAYAPEWGEEMWTESVLVEEDRASYELTGLTPGTTYRCRAVGTAGEEYGTGGAVQIYSDEVTFVTIAADVPTLGACTIVTQGPTTLLLEVVIVDEGGYPVAEVGVEVEEQGASAKGKVRLQPTCAEDSAGYRCGVGSSRTLPLADASGAGSLLPYIKQVLVEGLTPGCSYRLTPYATNAVGTGYGEALSFMTGEAYVVEEPGRLADLLAESTLPERRLVISGPLNGADFSVIRSLFGVDAPAGVTLLSLDLSGARIVAGGGSYDGSRMTVDDTVTTGLLASLPRLEDVRLPMGAVAIERDALADCPALRSLGIPAGVREVVPSEGCTALGEIRVEDGNGWYAAVDGVLYDKAVQRLVWFPCGKEGRYRMPGTVTAIGRNAFRGTRITGLELPDALTEIERGAFSGSALEEIRMPGGLTNVAEGMFQGCAALRAVSLGAATEWLGAYVFDGVPLERLEVAAEWPPVVTAETFVSRSSDTADAGTCGTGDVRTSCVLAVPASSVAAYRAHPQWGKFECVSL